MSSHIRIATQIGGWLLSALGWIVVIPSGLFAVAVLLTGSAYFVYGIPFCLVGVAAMTFGCSLRRPSRPLLQGRSISHGQPLNARIQS